MDYGELVHDALAFTRKGVYDIKGRWLRLILGIILLGLPMNGYIVRVYRGDIEAPEMDRWGSLFFDGLRLTIIGFVYAIPVIILWILAYGKMLAMVFTGVHDHNAGSMMAGWSPNLGLIILMYIFEIIIAILLPIASIRFARANTIKEAFHFGAIAERIHEIGWINYIIAVIFIAIIVAIPIAIIAGLFILIGGIIAVISGFSLAIIAAELLVAVVLFLCIMPLFTVFQARFMARVYDSVPPAEV